MKETAAFLRISHTPVREALERLVGEGAVTTSVDRLGFEMPRRSSREVAELHELTGLMLEHMAKQPVANALSSDAFTIDAAEADKTMEGILEGRCRLCSSSALASALRRTMAPLAPYRRVEPLVIASWASGVRELRSALFERPPEAGAIIAAFTAERIAAAAAVVAAVDDQQTDRTDISLI